MQIIQIIYFTLLGSLSLGATPWDLDPQSKEFLNSQIEASHQRRTSESAAQGIEYLIDYDRTRLNFYSDSCTYCQNQETDQHLEEKLKHAGFKRKLVNTISQRKAHCFGTTLFFTKYLLTHSQVKFNSCAQILSEVLNDPNFKHLAHSFSMNQHADYFLKDSSDPLEIDSSAMKVFFQILMEEAPMDYYFLPISQSGSSAFDKVAIYATLHNLRNKLLVIGYTTPDGFNHCIAVSTNSKKFFVFDSNLGLFQFDDLETLSWSCDKVLKGSQFRWLVSFPFAD